MFLPPPRYRSASKVSHPLQRSPARCSGLWPCCSGSGPEHRVDMVRGCGLMDSMYYVRWVTNNMFFVPRLHVPACPEVRDEQRQPSNEDPYMISTRNPRKQVSIHCGERAEAASQSLLRCARKGHNIIVPLAWTFALPRLRTFMFPSVMWAAVASILVNLHMQIA